MPSRLLRNDDIDRASGTRLGTLWSLPAFGVVLPGVVMVASHDLGPGTRWVWTAVAAVCATCFAWAWLEWSRARRFVRFLHDREEELETTHSNNGPAWIAHVVLSKSGRTVYFNDKALKRTGRSGGSGNHYDLETGEK